MHHNHNRNITINKKKLIDKIKENKAKHIAEFKEAKKAYKAEAERQLKELLKDAKAGKFDLQTRLTTPIDRSSEYDKVIEMFSWDTQEEITITQSEFNEYVHDENPMAQAARYSNMFYSAGGR